MHACALLKRRRFTVEEFRRMSEFGVFAPDARLELLDGEIIEMAPVGPRHITCVFALDDFLRSIVGPEIRVATQYALQVASDLALPDAMLLVRERHDPTRVPDADACILVVEVADSTWLVDRNVKPRAYASAGIPEYWVVDLRSDSVVRHLSSRDGTYANVEEYGRDRVFASPALGGREVRVADLLGTPTGEVER